MKVSIKARDRAWILAAMAEQWRNELSRSGHDVTVDFDSADHTSQIHIHFIADDALLVDGHVNVVVVTHIDFYWKILNCIQLYRKGVGFICLSKQTENTLKRFMPRAQIFTVTPRSLHFGPIPIPKKITFGLFFRLYDDNRKNQSAIETLVNMVVEHSSMAHILIFGAGFENILGGKPTDAITYVPILAGNFDVESYRSYLRMCDYVVYFGRDEGAISVLDAATLGIPVLATDQGYHRDIPLPTGSLLLNTADAICQIIKQLIHSHSGKTSEVTLNDIIEKDDGNRCSTLEYYILILRSIFIDNPFYFKTRFTQDIHYNYKRSAALNAMTHVLDQIKISLKPNRRA
jgi:glycosyltransferase involved in cell wall biosynthesis